MKNLLNFIQPHPHTTLYIPSQSISNSLTTKTITSLPITKPSSHFSTKNFSLVFPTQSIFKLDRSISRYFSLLILSLKWIGWQEWWPKGRWWYLARALVAWATQSKPCSRTSVLTLVSTSSTRFRGAGKSRRRLSAAVAARRSPPCSSAASWWVEPMRSWAFTLRGHWSLCSGRLELYGFDKSMEKTKTKKAYLENYLINKLTCVCVFVFTTI